MVKENAMKQTEIGLLPEDWEVKKIFQISQIRTGGKNTQDKMENGLYPFIVRSQTVERINSYSFDGEAILTAGDGVGVGKVFHYLNGKFDYHQRVYSISNFDKNVSGFYFFKYFQNNFYYRIMQMTAKSSVDSVRMETIADMQIPLPPLPEQEAIAEALSDADVWIESLEQLIAKKRLIKQGAMQELLSPKEDWEVKKLGDLVVINSGHSPSMFNFSEDGVPYLKVDELNNSAKYTVKGSYFIKTYYTIKKGSIIFPKRGASIFLNKIRILGEDCFMDTNLMTLTISENCDNEFLYYSLIYFGLNKVADTTSIPQINNKHILPLEIPFPSLTEQNRIATILSDMDLELEALEVQLTKARQLKQGMMQELLTGRVRLV